MSQDMTKRITKDLDKAGNPETWSESKQRNLGVYDRETQEQNAPMVVGAIMSWYTGNPSWFMAGANYQSQQYQNDVRQIELNMAAKEEQTTAREAEIQRRERILKVLAAQNVAGAASGTESYSGSNRNLMNQSVSNFNKDQLSAKAMSDHRRSSINFKKKSSKQSTKINQASSLIDTYQKSKR